MHSAFFLSTLFLFGTLFWSFSSVVITRTKDRKSGIATGRSQCPYCGKTLTWKELIPIVSYAVQGGRCAGKDCRKKIPFMYPALELTMGALFAMTGAFLVDLGALASGDLNELARLAFFLAVAFVSVVTVFYDLLFMEVTDEVLIPAIAIGALLLGTLPESSALFRHFEPVVKPDFLPGEAYSFLPNWQNALLWALAIYSFFYLQFLIPAASYCLRKKAWKDAWSVVWHFVWLPFAVTAELFKKRGAVHDEGEELPTWIGLGDLRIAIFMGVVGGLKIAALGVFFAYLIGSVVGLYFLIIARKRNVRVPFGPFLVAGLYASLLWYSETVARIFPTLP